MAAYLDLGISITAFNNASRPLKQVGDDVKRVGENAQATANRLKAIQVVIAGILINKSLELGRAFTKMAADNQTLSIRLAAFAGNAQKAGAVQDQLSRKFAASGLVVDDLAQSFIDIRQAVKSNEQGVELVSAMANSVLALGGNQRNIDNLAQSFQKLGGIGTATKRDLTSLITNTSITLPDLAKAAGQTAVQFEGNMRKGFLNTQTLIEAFIKASKEKIGAFGENLGATIGGSFSFIRESLDAALDSLGNRTDVNARLAVLFTNIGKGIRSFIDSIDQSKIDAFFDFLKRMEPVVRTLIGTIIKLGSAVLTVASTMLSILGVLPQGALEYGIFGYLFFGKKGAAIFALMGGAKAAIDEARASLTAFLDKMTGVTEAQAKQFDAAMAARKKAITDFFKGGKPDDNKSIFGDQKQLDAAKKTLSDMLKSLGSFGQSDQSGIGFMLDEAIQKAEDLRREVLDIIDAMQGRIDSLNFNTAGDELGAKIQAITNETRGWVDQIEKTIQKMKESDIPLRNHVALTETLRDKIKQANEARDQAIAKEQRLAVLKRYQVFLEQESLRHQLAQEKLALAREANPSPSFNFASGTSGGQVVQQMQDKLNELQSRIDGYNSQINESMTSMQGTNDQGQIEGYQRTIDTLEDLKVKTEDYMGTLDASVETNKQLWRELGQTIEQDVASGISGLIKGTMTLGDVFRNIFSDMIDMGVKFLLQLVEIQLFGEVAAAASLAASAPVAAAQMAIWSPAAIAASIATLGGADAIGVAAYQAAIATSLLPFKDGGVPGLGEFSNRVVSGPTMFGMMGEAGDEAIMPLTRIGGKLGVRAEGGGGGNSYHITVQAQDTQSGLEFIGKHIEYIDARLAHNRLLNNGAL